MSAPLLLLSDISAALGAASGSPWLQTLGRLHVVTVHFPIALLVLAGLIELTRRRSAKPSATAITCLALGAAGAIVASTLGTIHRGFSDFTGDSSVVASRHQWLGFTTAAVATAARVVSLIAARRQTTLPQRISRWTTVACALLVAFTAHL